MEQVCKETLAQPVLLGRAEMALALAQRFLGDADEDAPHLRADREVQLDFDPAHFNETVLVHNPELEDFFQVAPRAAPTRATP